MSFTRAHPTGYPVNGKIPSAEMNQLDIDHANALDKTTAGDTLSGVITTVSTGSIHIAASGSKIQTLTGGRIEHADNDYTLLASGHTGRSRSIVWPISFGTGTPSYYTNIVDDGLVSQTQGGSILVPLRLHHGATLSSVTMYFTITAFGRDGNLPVTLPTLGVFRTALDGTRAYLNSGGDLHPTNNANLVSYDQSGAQQSYVYTCNQNNVIDVTAYSYCAFIVDEGGTHSVVGNRWSRFVLSMTNIVDMRHQ